MNHTLSSLTKFIRDRGLVSTIGTAIKYAYFYPYSLLRLRLRPNFDSSEELVKYAFTGCGGLFSPFQVWSEFVEFLDILRDLSPKRALEIGTASGGSLFAITRVAHETAHIISLDLPQGLYGGGYQKWKEPMYRGFRMAHQKLDLVRADSHLPETFEDIKSRLNGELLDFLFIDGDHTYEGAKADYDMYSPLVRSGGLIAFHDIVPNKPDESYGVDRVWGELKEGRNYTELVEDWEQVGAGIGLIRVS